MADLCSLQKDHNGPRGYSSGSVNLLLDIVSDYLAKGIEKYEETQDITIARLYVAKALLEVGNKYVNTQIGPISGIIEDFFNEYYEGAYALLLPDQGVANTISRSRRAALGEKDIDLDYYLGVDKEKNTSFLDNTFGVLTDIRNRFMQDVTRRLINVFAIDRENGKLITDIQMANIEARLLKEQLYLNVKNYLGVEGLSDTLYDGDSYTGALENAAFKSAIMRLEARLNPTDVENTYNDMYKAGDSEEDAYFRGGNAKVYKAMMDYYTLKNFDNLTDYILGELITVNPVQFGQMADGNTYTYTAKANHLIKSWGQDGRSLELDISKFIQRLINTTPLYRNGSMINTGEYITFEDFYRTITRIKNLAYHPKASEYIFYSSDRKNLDFLNKLSLSDKLLVTGKSFRWLVNQIRENPLKYTRIVMQALNDSKMGLLDYLEIKKSDKDYIFSIYKGFFDPNYKNSIRAILNTQKHNAKQYYQSVTQAVDSMFDVNFMQYYQQDDGSIVARSSNDLNRDKTRQAIELGIHKGNSRRTTFFFEDLEMKPYKAVPTYSQDGKKLQGLTYKLLLNNGKELTILLDDLGQNIAFTIDGTLVSNESELWNNNSVLLFIDQLLKLDIVNDHAFRATIEDVMGSNTFRNLMTLSSIVLFNKYIASVEMEGIMGRNASVDKLKEIYGESAYRPDFDYNSNQIQLFPNLVQDMFNILDGLASAKNIVTGQADATRVRDAEGNNLPTQTTSRLYGSLLSQWELIRDEEKAGRISPASHFSLLKPGLLKQIYSAKEVISQAGNKDYSKFTVAEAMQANFLYDFIAGFVNSSDVAKKKIIGNGAVGLLTSINSDKSTYAKMVIDTKQSADGINTWESMPQEELEQITRNELGQYYTKLLMSVANTYNLLLQFMQSEQLYSDLVIDYNNNFYQFNESCAALGKKAVDVLNEITLAYNKKYPMTPIVLIDQTHYIKADKKGLEIIANNNIKGLLKRFANKERYDAFMYTKELDIIKALIDENVIFNLFDAQDNISTPKRWLKDNYPEWVSPSAKMIIAKVNVNGETFNIVSKADLLNLLDAIGADFSKNLHALREYDVTIHPMLKKFNALDYLFSQEFLLSSVGTHSNHPSKAKTKPSIIWTNQPYLISEAYQDDVIIFDELYTNDEERDLLWEKAKIRASRENKILITSDPLLEFSKLKDFTNVVKEGGDILKVLKKAIWQMLDNEIAEDASRFLAQMKRNVSLTATMYPFQRHLFNGPPTKYNMAILADIFYDVYTLNGEITDWVPFDGATFVNPLVVYWENFALDEAKAGIDKKPFVHFYDIATGTGGIIKTAGFGLTNDRILSHRFYRIMVKNMMDRPWVNEDNSIHIVEGNGILKDFEGQVVDYGEFYFQKGGQYYMRKITKYLGNNTYEAYDTVVDESGVPMGDSDRVKLSNINSNYRVWKMFGGEHSMELDHNGLLVPSEQSIINTVRASIEYGIPRKGVTNIETAADIYLPMKHSDIHWAPTVGAIKQGAANINSSDAYYKVQLLNHMIVDMRQGGIQLDKEHQADQSTLSLMTQVVAGAAAKGYTLDKSTGLYLALYNLTKIKTREFRDALGNITLDPDKFDAAAAHIILKAVMNSSTTDGELIQIIAKDLINAMKEVKDFELTKEFAKKVNDEIPYSNRGIYKKFVTILTSTLTKLGIKLEVSGTLSVLNPTQDAIKLYKVPLLNKKGTDVVRDSEGNIRYTTVNYGQLLKYAGLTGVTINEDSDIIGETEDAILDVLLQNYAETLYVKGVSGHLANVDIGRNYEVTEILTNELGLPIIDETTGLPKTHTYRVALVFPNNVRSKQKMKNGLNIWGYADLKNPNIISIKEYVKEGNDLDAYTIRFSDGKNVYQSADLAILLDFFDLKMILDGRNQYIKGILLLGDYGKLQTFIDLVNKDLKAQLQKNGDTEAQRLVLEELRLLERGLAVDLYDSLEALKTKEISEYIHNVLNYLRLAVQKVLNRQLLLTLNAISPTDLKINSVKIRTVDGEDVDVQIDKKSIKISAYGAIMAKIFKTSLGLEQHDDLETIKNDPNFFIERLVRNYSTKVNNFVDYDSEGNEVYINNYHLELKRTNGKHIYIRQGLSGARLTDKVDIRIFKDKDGRVYRVDDHNRIIYELSSDLDKVYRDYEGNEIIVTKPDEVIWEDHKGQRITVVSDEKGNLKTSSGDEIVKLLDGSYYNLNAGETVTRTEISGTLFYLDNMEYNSFYINLAVSDNEFISILNRTINSTNTVANKLGLTILDYGKYEKNLNKAVIKQRELSDSMNDYEALYKEYESNKDKPISELKYSKGYQAFKHLAKTGREMHTSFLKTLNIVAARIPAQNQQSFMAMKIQAYDNPNINSAYVSTYQFFLLGSDLDIDAVSLLTFTLNKGGLFVGHSPYYSLFNEELLKASEKIPIPTGIEVKTDDKSSTFKKYSDWVTVRHTGISEEALDEADKLLLDVAYMDTTSSTDGGFIVLNFRKNGEIKVSFDLTTVKKIENLISLLKETSFGIGDIEATVKDYNNWANDESTITEELLESINKLLIDLINKHNLYINKASASKQEAIARNYLTQLTYDIIIDPINLLQALSSVDGVTGPTKRLAATSDKSTLQETFSTGNVANKHQSISGNSVGKDGIAVCATDLKGYFALTLLFNMVMSRKVSKNATPGQIAALKAQKESLIDRIITIGGRDYRGLANTFTNEFATGEVEYGILSPEEQLELDNNFTENIKEYLVELYLAMDASNVKSGMLSLSADNAKELVLDKINAGTATLGMYLYGVSLGIPFETLFKIINSPFGNRISALTRGDIFNGNRGTVDVIGALDYLYTEPTSQLATFDGMIDTTIIPVEYLPSQVLSGKNGLRAKIVEMFTEKKALLGEGPDTIDIIKRNIRNRIEAGRANIATQVLGLRDLNDINITDLYLKNYEIVLHQAVDFAQQYAEDVILTLEESKYITAFGESNIADDFETLAMGAVETKQLGKNLRINLGILTDPNQMIDLVDNMQNLIVNRISLLRRYLLRHPNKKITPKNMSTEDAKIFEFLTNPLNSEYKNTEKIDIKEFVTNPSYADGKIKIYNILRATYNPLWVLKAVPHYKGYLETLYNAYESSRNLSAKFRYISDSKKQYENKFNIHDLRLKDLVGRNMENAVDTFFRREWMKERYAKKKPTMHASSDSRTVMAFVDNPNKPRIIGYLKELQLGTDLGDANFKLWLEQVVIPEFKQKYKNNKFILALTWTGAKSSIGTYYVSMGMPVSVNMMPHGEGYDKGKFDELKKAFNELKREDLYKDAAGTLWSPQELLYLYSLITTNGRISPTSIHGIFQDYLDSAPARSFHKKIAEYDLSKEKQEGKYIGKYGELLKAITDEDIAPISSPYVGGSDMFRSLDRDTEEVLLWRKADNQDEELGQMNPEELPRIINGYEAESLTSGFNTEFFLDHLKVSRIEGVGTLNFLKDHPVWSNYDVIVEKIGNKKVGLVSIKAKNPEDLAKADGFFKLMRDENAGLLPTKKIINGLANVEDLIDIETMTDYLNSIECLSV